MGRRLCGGSFCAHNRAFERGGSMKSVLGNKKSIAVFVLPAFIIYAVFALFPIGYNVYMSLFDTNLMSPGKFVGLKNYISLFQDSTFTHALRNNILMVVGSLIAHMPLAMFFANAIFKKIKGAAFFQTVFFLPSVICGVAVGLTWSFIYNGNYGLLNAFLKLIGLGDLQQVWLSNKNLALFCLYLSFFWSYLKRPRLFIVSITLFSVSGLVFLYLLNRSSRLIAQKFFSTVAETLFIMSSL